MGDTQAKGYANLSALDGPKRRALAAKIAGKIESVQRSRGK
jgi:hypothetical protein